MQFNRGGSNEKQRASSGGSSARVWASKPAFRQGYIDAQFGKRAYRGSQEWSEYCDKDDCESYEAGRFTAVFATMHKIKAPYWYDPKVVPKDITQLIYSLCRLEGGAFVFGKTRKGR